jgi:uncharacterized protein (TIGR02246 family)
MAASNPGPNATLEDEKNAIRQLSREFLEAERSKDIPRLLSLFTDDIAFLMPVGPALRGKAAVESLYRGFFAQYLPEHSAAIEQIEIRGDWAYTWGAEKLKLRAQGASPWRCRARASASCAACQTARGNWRAASIICSLCHQLRHVKRAVGCFSRPPNLSDRIRATLILLGCMICSKHARQLH